MKSCKDENSPVTITPPNVVTDESVESRKKRRMKRRRGETGMVEDGWNSFRREADKIGKC